jgi:DME family drug/metabolite transporter
MRKYSGEIWIVLGAILWGTTGTSQAFAPENASSLSIGAVRLTIGGIALFAFSRWRGYSFRNNSWPRTSTLISGLSMAAYNLLFFAGVSKTGVAVGTIVTIGSSPILAGLLGWLIRKEQPGWKWVLATVVAVIGGIILVLPGEKLTIDVLGIMYALLSGLAYATFAVTSKNLLEYNQPEVVMTVVFCLGALLLSPLLFFQDLSWFTETRGWMSALHLGVFATASAYIFYGHGLKFIPVAKATTLTLAEPLTASLLGIFVLGERLNTSAGLGIGLIFIGLTILTIRIGENAS